MNRLSGTRTVFRRTVDHDVAQPVFYFQPPSERWQGSILAMRRAEYLELGSPEYVTVTIAPGDWEREAS